MPISPNLALGLLASLTVATWALAWIVHESQRRSAWIQQERVRVQGRLLTGPSEGRRRRTRRRSSSSRRRARREARPAAAAANAAAESAPAPLAPQGLDQVQAPLPSAGGAAPAAGAEEQLARRAS